MPGPAGHREIVIGRGAIDDAVVLVRQPVDVGVVGIEIPAVIERARGVRGGHRAQRHHRDRGKQ